jgi:hypothetical protein
MQLQKHLESVKVHKVYVFILTGMLAIILNALRTNTSSGIKMVTQII